MEKFGLVDLSSDSAVRTCTEYDHPFRPQRVSSSRQGTLNAPPEQGDHSATARLVPSSLLTRDQRVPGDHEASPSGVWIPPLPPFFPPLPFGFSDISLPKLTSCSCSEDRALLSRIVLLLSRLSEMRRAPALGLKALFVMKENGRLLSCPRHGSRL